MAGDETDPNATLRRVIIAVFAAAWTVSFVAGLALPAYEPSPYVNAMGAAILAWATGKDLLRRNGGDE